MKNVWEPVFSVWILFSIIGCSHDICINPIDIETHNIVLDTSNSKPLMRLKVDDVICLDEYGNPMLSGYWGEIHYTYSAFSKCYEFQINENLSKKDRIFVLIFGSGDEICKICLRQHH